MSTPRRNSRRGKSLADSVGRKLGEHFRIKSGDKRRRCLNELGEGISRISHGGVLGGLEVRGIIILQAS